jgi:serine/threonine protein kinase/tetratricopeptide (TPR) repeat protein
MAALRPCQTPQKQRLKQGCATLASRVRKPWEQDHEMCSFGPAQHAAPQRDALNSDAAMPDHDALSTAQWNALQALFERALETRAEDRGSLVEQVRAEDPVLGQSLAEMLASDEQWQGRTGDARSDLQRQARASTVLATGETIGPYRIVGLLGEGGFGAVYEAEQEHPVRRRVALKLIKLGMDTGDVIARFKAERQALALMNHPHIARVFDAGATESGRPYFVMELVHGEAVSSYCIRHRLSIGQRLEIFDQVCAAIQHAHIKGVIHRDLKPNNVLVGEQDGKPYAWIIDFGIAKAISGQLTEQTLLTERYGVIGTLTYMSPEQAEGSVDIDARTDVYSLGVILYELLTETTPLDSNLLRVSGYAEMLRFIRDVDPPLPSARLRQADRSRIGESGNRSDSRKHLALVRGDLDWIVMKAIEKDRRRRYDTVGDLATDLRRHRAGQPVVAAPPSFSYRLGKIARRHRNAMTIGALLIALVAITVVAVIHSSETSIPATRTAASVPGKSIAVLPFENLSSDKDNAYFADGMQDTILTKLGGITGLKVISRTSTAKYTAHPDNLKAIAAQLGTDTILEGSVQKAGNQVLINVQLIDARSDRHLWAQTYRRTLDNVFDVEGEVAQAVADALDAKLTVAEQRAVKAKPTKNPAAYDAYLRGLALASNAEYGARSAAVAFEQAVRQDPAFVLAWSWLSREDAWMVATGEDPSVERKRKAREAMETVQRLAPGSVESLIAQGYYRYRVELDFQGARQFFEQAHALSRNDVETLWPLAMIARRQGRWAQSNDLLEQAISIDPRDPLTVGAALANYVAERDIANAQRIVDLYSASGSGADPLEVQAALLVAKCDIKALKRLLDQWPDSKPRSQNDWFPERYFALARDYPAGIDFLQAELPNADSQDQRADIETDLGDLFRLSGDAKSARSSYQEAHRLKQAELQLTPDNDNRLRDMAMIEAGLGDEKAAITNGQHALEIDMQRSDQYLGPKDIEVLARIQARFGKKEAAITALQHLIGIPYAGPVTVPMLQLDPDWDGLRDDPRFKQLLRDHVPDQPGPS